MTTRKEVKCNIMRKIMELRTKDLIEEDSILDVLDDNLDPYITELENKIKCLEGQSSLHEGILWNDVHKFEEENTKLRNEVLEVRQHLDLTEREWGKDTTKLYHYKTQVSKAKELLERFMNVGDLWEIKGKEFLTLQSDVTQFLKEE